MLSMTSQSIDDDRLLQLMSTGPKRSIILIEDIDAVFDKDKGEHDGPAAGTMKLDYE